jgi:hypothetical protein
MEVELVKPEVVTEVELMMPQVAAEPLKLSKVDIEIDQDDNPSTCSFQNLASRQR